MMRRREFVGATASLLLAGCVTKEGGTARMEEAYGLIGEMKAVRGKREELIAILLSGTREMPGNIAYQIAEDLSDPDTLWITEIWRTKTDHANSLQLPGVQDAIAKGRPLIAGFGMRIETRPVIQPG